MDYTEAVDIVSGLFKIDGWMCNEYGERYAVLDDDVEIRVSQSGPRAMLIQAMFDSPIENVAVANSEETKLSYLLQANFIQVIHSDNILAVDRKTKRLSVTKVLELAGATFESISNDVEFFIRSADFWNMAAKRKQSSGNLSPLLSFSLRK